MKQFEASVKPHLAQLKRELASIDADARLTPEQKAFIFATLEGLVSMPRIKWAQVAERNKQQQGGSHAAKTDN